MPQPAENTSPDYFALPRPALPRRGRRRPALRWPVLALLAIAGLPSCSGRSPREAAVAVGDQFFESPAAFGGQVVRLSRLRTVRADPTHPLQFAAYDRPDHALTVSDPRGLSRQRNIQQHQVVAVVFRCTEGELDRGNLLLAIE